MATPNTRTILEQNRDFFEAFFTRVVKIRFKSFADESPLRKITIVAGVCTSAYCRLSANNNILVLRAAQMASTNPEIHFDFEPAPKSGRSSIRSSIRYQPPMGWVNSDSSEKVADLTTWLDRVITEFLTWSSTLNTT